MSLRRFLVDPAALGGPVVVLPPEEAAHARRVLRLAPGDPVELLDGAGRRAAATIEQIDRRRVTCRVQEVSRPDRPRPRLVLCLGLLKNPAMDLAVVKLTELMAEAVRPFTTSRTVVRSKDQGKSARWDRLAGQALKQCGATYRPHFSEPAPLARVLAGAPAGAARLLLYEEYRGQTLAQALRAAGDPDEVWVVIGPEGGLAPEEVDQAAKAGFSVCRLPGATLRAETAAIAAAALVRFGGMGE